MIIWKSGYGRPGFASLPLIVPRDNFLEPSKRRRDAARDALTASARSRLIQLADITLTKRNSMLISTVHHAFLPLVTCALLAVYIFKTVPCRGGQYRRHYANGLCISV